MRNIGCSLAAVAAILSAGTVRAEEPKLDTTADLVAYCDNVGPVGEVRDGQNFCDRFIAGTGLLYLELVKSKKIKKLACAQPVPTLTEAREAFVSWANANPEHLSDKPIDGFWRAMSASYPCSK